MKVYQKNYATMNTLMLYYSEVGMGEGDGTIVDKETMVNDVK